jgi:hypothetical protein
MAVVNVIVPFISEMPTTLRAGDCIFSIANKTKIIIWEKDFVYVTVQYQQLRD